MPTEPGIVRVGDIIIDAPLVVAVSREDIPARYDVNVDFEHRKHAGWSFDTAEERDELFEAVAAAIAERHHAD